MDYTDDRDALSFVSGLALGVLVGAGIALLVAPESGRRTRRRLQRAAEDLGDSAAERLQDAAEDVRRVAEDAVKAAERSGDRLRDSVRKTRSRLNR